MCKNDSNNFVWPIFVISLQRYAHWGIYTFLLYSEKWLTRHLEFMESRKCFRLHDFTMFIQVFGVTQFEPPFQIHKAETWMIHIFSGFLWKLFIFPLTLSSYSILTIHVISLDVFYIIIKRNIHIQSWKQWKERELSDQQQCNTGIHVLCSLVEILKCEHKSLHKQVWMTKSVWCLRNFIRYLLSFKMHIFGNISWEIKKNVANLNDTIIFHNFWKIYLQCLAQWVNVNILLLKMIESCPIYYRFPDFNWILF